MDSVVKVTCRRCGDVDMPGAGVEWWVSNQTGDGHLLFRCACCGELQIRDVLRHVIYQLQAADVPQWHPELLEVRPPGPPINLDDLADLQAALREDRWPDDHSWNHNPKRSK